MPQRSQGGGHHIGARLLAVSPCQACLDASVPRRVGGIQPIPEKAGHTSVSTLLYAFMLVAATVVLHTIGLVAVLKVLLAKHARAPTRFWPMTLLLIEVAWILILIHAIEVGVWALFYLWAGCLPDAESAFYFSGVTYATIGYGDVVLAQP